MEIIQRSSLVPYCEIRENDSGLHFLLKLKTLIPDHTIEEKLLEHGIRILALSDYDLLYEENKAHYFIINYSNLNVEKIEHAFGVIETFLKEETVKQ